MLTKPPSNFPFGAWYAWTCTCGTDNYGDNDCDGCQNTRKDGDTLRTNTTPQPYKTPTEPIERYRRWTCSCSQVNIGRSACSRCNLPETVAA